ncbi:MAG: hypothetical protein ACKOYJ_09525 [Planctomycetia bacterium]
MYPAEIFRDTLSRLIEILARHGVGFHLTGGITSVAYGEPRMTQDIDIVVDNAAMARSLDGFMADAVEARFVLDAQAVRHAVAERLMFQLFDMAEALKIDIYPREMIPGELGRSAMLEVFEGMSLPVASRPCMATNSAGSQSGPVFRQSLETSEQQHEGQDHAEGRPHPYRPVDRGQTDLFGILVMGGREDETGQRHQRQAEENAGHGIDE